MKPVQQRQLWRPEWHRDGPQVGDCLRCCVASIFEVSYEDVADIGPSTQHVFNWVRERFPGVKCEARSLTDYEDDWKQDLSLFQKWPSAHAESGYWIGTIWSPRIPSVLSWGCGCTSRVEGGDPECEWCHGRPQERFMGVRWGLHAVVMKDNALAFDPHPEAKPMEIMRFSGATTFVGL